MSWAGLCKIPYIELSMIRGCAVATSSSSRTAKTHARRLARATRTSRCTSSACSTGTACVCSTRSRLWIHLPCACTSVCLTPAGARREMMYRVCFPAQSGDTTACEQRRHESLDGAIEDALHVLRQFWHSICRFHAGYPPRGHGECAVARACRVFMSTTPQPSPGGTMQQTEYESPGAVFVPDNMDRGHGGGAAVAGADAARPQRN